MNSPSESRTRRPIVDVGIGLRDPHLEIVLSESPAVPWFELLADNYFNTAAPHLEKIERVRRDYPMTFHCVGMSLGSTDALSRKYFNRLQMLQTRLQPAWISDHLCFTHVDARYYHDLLPLPYTEESLEHFSARVQQAQEWLGEVLVIENPSSYISYAHSTIPEAEFLNAVAQRTGCQLLLDINNVYVNAINHGISATEYLDTIDFEHVREIHLGGHEDRGDYLLDAHNNRVIEPVWDLYRYALQIRDDIPCLIEWDNDLPGFDVLLDEARRAQAAVDVGAPPVAAGL